MRIRHRQHQKQHAKRKASQRPLKKLKRMVQQVILEAQTMPQLLLVSQPQAELPRWELAQVLAPHGHQLRNSTQILPH